MGARKGTHFPIGLNRPLKYFQLCSYSWFEARVLYDTYQLRRVLVNPCEILL
jgi:hypothetical protein